MTISIRQNSLRKPTSKKTKSAPRPGRAAVRGAAKERVRKRKKAVVSAPAIASVAVPVAAVRVVRHPDELSDKAIAALVAGGDQVAWRKLYDKWVVELTRYGSSQGWDRELVADLVQDTLIRAWSKSKSYDPKYPYRVWILTIFRRLAMTHYRRVKTHGKTVGEQPAKTGQAPWWAENQTDMSGTIDANDIRATLDPLIQTLKPEDQRLLREWSHGVCQATLAKELGTNPVTLRTQILRAKARLFKAFKEKYPELVKAGWASQVD